MNKALTKSLTLMSLAVLLAVPTVGHASLPFFRSSMNVQCLFSGGVCTKLRFGLDVEGYNRLTAATIANTNTSAWDFRRIDQIYNAGGSVGYFGGVVDYSWMDVEFAGALLSADEPLFIVIDVQGSTGTAADLAGSFTYAALGYGGADGTEAFKTYGSVSGADATAGTVTPEPETVVLLAIGLALLGGVAFMRSYT